jgi:hypothetical protein
VVPEFVKTQPLQFVYFLGSDMTDMEMVLPHTGQRVARARVTDTVATPAQ